MSPRKKFNKIQLPVSQLIGGICRLNNLHPEGGRVLRILSYKDDQMGVKSKPKKSLFILKPYPEFPSHKSLFAGTISSGDMRELSRIVFLTAKKNPYLNEATQKYTSQKSRNKKLQTPKNPSIIPVTWNPE